MQRPGSVRGAFRSVKVAILSRSERRRYAMSRRSCPDCGALILCVACRPTERVLEKPAYTGPVSGGSTHLLPHSCGINTFTVNLKVESWHHAARPPPAPPS